MPRPTRKLTPVRTVIYLRTSSVSVVTLPIPGASGSRPIREGVGKAIAALIIKKKIASASPNWTRIFATLASRPCMIGPTDVITWSTCSLESVPVPADTSALACSEALAIYMGRSVDSLVIEKNTVPITSPSSKATSRMLNTNASQPGRPLRQPAGDRQHRDGDHRRQQDGVNDGSRAADAPRIKKMLANPTR